MSFAKFEIEDNTKLRHGSSIPNFYTEDLIDLSKRPQPCRAGCKAPMLVYDSVSVGIGFLGENAEWTIVGTQYFKPTHARFIPNVDYQINYATDAQAIINQRKKDQDD